MKCLLGWIVSGCLAGASVAQADNAEQALQQCVQLYVKQHILVQPDRDELVSRSLVHCQPHQQAYSGAVLIQLLSMDVPPRAHARALALTQGIKTALIWANDSVDELAAI
ncbi:hypothetical protein [Simiduia agarivorans]|uniref:Uncharacterized protein n=1 Tax=Simiduia agarivorans (strain DSM 21679 / JCM 13881 / BCRC 17597 / SA1) TaxID=1117647 RepID=K4KWN7_SIMAS|nr:hypothetical protein [Simiduia agarivorans]AFU98347.1 hypothetical protein M5M_05710 [Simiduia agarivorans SA1 = DSM 21679]